MEDQAKTLGIVAGVGAALGVGLALGMGLRVLAWGAALGIGAGAAIALATAAKRRPGEAGMVEAWRQPALH
jgi:hypothetical protein